MSMLFKRIKDWAVSIASFRTGDVIAVDGPNGTAKMSKDSLLKETAQNALAGNLAPAFDPTRTENDPYIAYKDSCVHEGELYECITNHYGPWVAAHFEPASAETLFAKKGFGTDEIKNLTTTIPSFRTGDVIAVDGPNGPAKMSASRVASAEPIIERTEYTSGSTYTNTKSGYYADTDGYHAQASFITYILEVSSDSSLFVQSFTGDYFSVTVYPNSSQTGGTRYRNSESNLPTELSPLTVQAGMYVAFTSKFDSFKVVIDTETGNSELSTSIQLAGQHINSVLDKVVTSSLADKTLTQNSDYTEVKNGYSADTGGISQNANFKTWVLQATHSGNLFANPFSGNYLAITVYPDSRLSGGVRYRNIDDNLPTSDNPVNIAAGNYIAITTRYESFSITLANYVQILTLNSEVAFGDSQLSKILSIQNCILCEFINESGEGSSTQRFEVNVPSKSGFIRYTYVHSVRTSIGCDCWRLNTVYRVNANGTTPLSPTSGEWELAIRLSTDSAYVGGAEHGHEAVDSAIFFIDGVQTALSDMPSGPFMCKEFSSVTSSTVSSLANVDFATHGVSHVFTSNGCKLTQSLKFLTDVQINYAFLCMGLALRSLTSKYYTDSEVVVKDFSPLNTNAEVKAIRLFGEVSLDIVVHKYPFLSNNKMKLQQYTTDNKFYAIVCYNDDHPVASGDILNSVHDIRFSAG